MSKKNADQKDKIKWFKSDFQGITYCEHDTRKHGVKYDKYFRGQYQVAGKRQTIGFGWASEGWTAKSVYYKIQEFRHNAKLGQKPTNLKEEREIQDLTFGWFWNESYYSAAKKEKKAKTLSREKSLYTKWIEPEIGDRLLK